MNIFVSLIRLLGDLLVILIIVQSLLSYVLSPYHPVRQALDRIVEPLLNPIRRVVPPSGSLDFSPMVLIFVIIIIETLLIGVFSIY